MKNCEVQEMEISMKKAGQKGITEKCVFCGIGKGYEDVNGQLLHKAGVTAHYFCMLFSSGLCQNGASDKEGVLGFLPEDIAKEVRRGSKLKCSYCKRPGATVGCVTKNCKKTFHLGCGRKRDSFHLFHDTFSSYCSVHRIQQDVPAEDDPNIVCSICMNSVKAAPCNESLRAPCCRKYWYHRDCIQQYSKSAGLYFFKCPMCNDKENFQKEMLAFGIYIPDQDASWETEPNAYQELLERYQHCDAMVCKCLEGRSYDKEGSKWEILLCAMCGSQGSHESCSHLIKVKGRQICPECFEIHHTKKGKESKKKVKSPRKSPLERLQQKYATSPVQTKNASSEYPGPSNPIQKRKIPSKFNSSKKSKKEVKSDILKKSSTVSSPVISHKKKTYTNPSESDRRKSQMGTSKCGKGKTNKTRTTFMERYLNSFVLSSSPSSSSTDSSVEDYLPSSYLKSSQVMSAFELKKAKKKRKKKENVTQKDEIELVGSDEAQKSKTKKMSVSNSALSSSCNSGQSLVSINGESKKATKPQKTLDSWLKWTSLKPVMSPKQETQSYDKSHVNLARSPRAQSGKPIIIDWHGKQLVIRSPKVFLNKHLSKTKCRPKGLKIDMVDERGNKGWDSELAVLSNIDPGVRVTRNMVSSNAISDLVSSSGQNTEAKQKKCCKTNASKEDKVDDGKNSAEVKSSLSNDFESVSLTHAAVKKAGENLHVTNGLSATKSCVEKMVNRSQGEVIENLPICTDPLIDNMKMCVETKLSELSEDDSHKTDEDVSNKLVCIVDASPLKKENPLKNSDQTDLDKSIPKNAKCRQQSSIVLDDSPNAKLLQSATDNEGKPGLSLLFEKKKFDCFEATEQNHAFSNKTSYTTDNPYKLDPFSCNILSKECNNNIDLETEYIHENNFMAGVKMNKVTAIEIDSSAEKVEVNNGNVRTVMDFSEHFHDIKGYENNKRKTCSELTTAIPKRFKHEGSEIGQNIVEKLDSHQSAVVEKSKPPKVSHLQVTNETYTHNLVQNGSNSGILEITEKSGENDLPLLNLGKGYRQKRKLNNLCTNDDFCVHDFSQKSSNELVVATTTSSPQHVKSVNTRSSSLQKQYDGNMKNMSQKQNMTIMSSLNYEFKDAPSAYLINPIIEKPWKSDSPSKSEKTLNTDTQHKVNSTKASPIKNSSILGNFSKPQDTSFQNQCLENTITSTVSQKMKGTLSPKSTTSMKNASPARKTGSMSSQKQKDKVPSNVSANVFNPKVCKLYDSLYQKLDSPSKNTRSSKGLHVTSAWTPESPSDKNLSASDVVRNTIESLVCTGNTSSHSNVRKDSKNTSLSHQYSDELKIVDDFSIQNASVSVDVPLSKKRHGLLNSSANTITTEAQIRRDSSSRVKNAERAFELDSPSRNTRSAVLQEGNIDINRSYMKLTTATNSRQQIDAQNTSSASERARTSSGLDSPPRHSRTAICQNEYSLSNKYTTPHGNVSLETKNTRKSYLAKGTTKVRCEKDSPDQASMTSFAGFKDKKDAGQNDSETATSVTQTEVCPGKVRRSLELDTPSKTTNDTSLQMSSMEKQRTALREVQPTSFNEQSSSPVRKEQRRATRKSLLSSTDKEKPAIESTLSAPALEEKKMDENLSPRPPTVARIKNYEISRMVRNDSSYAECKTVNEQDHCKQSLQPFSEQTRPGKELEKFTALLSEGKETSKMDSNYKTSTAKEPTAAPNTRQNSNDKSVMMAYYSDNEVDNRRETNKTDH